MAFSGNASIVSPLLYFNFIRYRAAFSTNTQAALVQLQSQLDGLSFHSRCPLFVRNAYIYVRDMIIKYGASDVYARAARVSREQQPEEMRGR